MQPVRTVYIIGFMGSGKTTVGKRLAAGLRWKFIDLDERIESHLGMSIPEIFQQEGEEYFRKAESNVLRELDTGPGTVISTGGGTPCSENNMKYMLETGLTIYLKLTPEQLSSRLSGSAGNRPLLNNLSADDLTGFVVRKLDERESWYNRAALIIDGFNVDYRLLFSLIRKGVRH